MATLGTSWYRTMLYIPPVHQRILLGFLPFVPIHAQEFQNLLQPGCDFQVGWELRAVFQTSAPFFFPSSALVPSPNGRTCSSTGCLGEHQLYLSICIYSIYMYMCLPPNKYKIQKGKQSMDVQILSIKTTGVPARAFRHQTRVAPRSRLRNQLVARHLEEVVEATWRPGAVRCVECRLIVSSP